MTLSRQEKGAFIEEPSGQRCGVFTTHYKW